MKTAVFYAIPAYGHINSVLPLLSRLSAEGYRVVCYATPEFQRPLERAGTELRCYPLKGRRIDLRDGSRLLRFYRLQLEVTAEWVEPLAREARELGAALLLHDSAAHWGRRVAELSGIPAAAFCSLVAVDRWGGPSFFAYAKNFSPVFWRDLSELPSILRQRRLLKTRYGFRRLGMLSTLMNWERLNVISYARELQLGGEGFDESFFFLGPSAVSREGTGAGRREKAAQKLLYVSLGTIFNTNLAFYRRLFRELSGTDYRVVVAAGGLRDQFSSGEIPANFSVEGYVDQRSLLAQAEVFLTAGGMNSLSEAAAFRTPCLIFPQQGEQKISGKRYRDLGFGLMLRPGKAPLPQLLRAEGLREGWNAELSRQITQVRMEELIERLRAL